MNIPSWYLLIPIFVPVCSGILVQFLKLLEKEKARNTFVSAILVSNALLILPVLFSADTEQTLFTVSDNLRIFLRIDDTGRLFCAVMSFVWCVAGIYSFEYMHHETHLSRYYAFYLATLGILMALCFSGSIITYYMFYELMTLLTVPLVMHTGEKQAVAAGIKYLIYSVTGASLVLLGVFVLSPYVSTFAFTAGGSLDAEKAAGHESTILVFSFIMMIGFGAKAGMFPLHGWLPTAHPVAPSPASAVLSGIITKAGVLGMFRLIYCFIGADRLIGTWVQTALLCLTLFTVFMGSMLAYQEKVLKKRLAFSSVSQVSYVLTGLATMHPLGVAGAFLHVVAHALIKDTLFMSAGAIISKTGKTRVSELRGIGRQMPCVMWCFTIAAVGLVGIPPCLGFVSKWFLAEGALTMNGTSPFMQYLVPAVLLISALLTAGYLITISIAAFFPGKNEDGLPFTAEKKEPGLTMLVPLMILTALILLLGMFPNGLIRFFTAIADSVLAGGL